MTLRHIKIFLAVCECGYNTTKAAKALNMTQPAVSLAIRELEQYYCVMLFERLGRRLQITEAGLKFQEYALHISALFDDMEQGMKEWDNCGRLKVGATHTIGAHFLPAYVKTFSQRKPGTDVRVQIAPLDQMEQKVLSNELDFALVEGIPHSLSLVSEEYMEDHLTVICPADGRFQQDQVLTQEEFRQQKFLMREPSSGTRELFERVIKSEGFSVEPIWESTSTTALINGVINGMGISVLPYRRVMRAIEQGLLISVNVEGLDFRRTFRIIYHKEKFLTKAAREFMELCRTYNNDDLIFY